MLQVPAYQRNKNKNKPTLMQYVVLFVCFLPFLRTCKDIYMLSLNELDVECSEMFSSDAAREAHTIPSLESCVRVTYVPSYWLCHTSRSGICPFKNYSKTVEKQFFRVFLT